MRNRPPKMYVLISNVNSQEWCQSKRKPQIQDSCSTWGCTKYHNSNRMLHVRLHYKSKGPLSMTRYNIPWADKGLRTRHKQHCNTKDFLYSAIPKIIQAHCASQYTLCKHSITLTTNTHPLKHSITLTTNTHTHTHTHTHTCRLAVFCNVTHFDGLVIGGCTEGLSVTAEVDTSHCGSVSLEHCGLPFAVVRNHLKPCRHFKAMLKDNSTDVSDHPFSNEP